MRLITGTPPGFDKIDSWAGQAQIVSLSLTIGGLDSAGTFPVLLDLTVYKVRASTLGMLTTYFGLYQSVSRAPGKVAFVLDSIFDPVEKTFGWIKRSVGRSCKVLFHAAD